MSNILFQAHSGWRYVVIVVAILVLIKYLIGWLGKGQWSTFDQRLGMAFPITIDIQWLLGIVLWLTGLSSWFLGRNVTSWEHLVTMTLALIVAVGLTAGAVAAGTSLRQPLLPSLRRE